MKHKIYTILFITVLSLGLASCSKCYDCTHEIEIEYKGQTTTTTSDPESYCTTTGEEIDQLENDGYTCTPS